jgi:two-component system, NarL family, response regulator DesR
MIRVMLVEDQALVLAALAALLEIEGDLQVVARATSGREALAALLDTSVDVVVTDVEMPELGGLELCAMIKQRRPTIRVVILTTFARSGYLKRAMEAGASAYLLKEAPASSLAAAIRAAHAGQRIVDPELAAEAWGEPDPLTARERQILRLVERGKATAAIADALALTEGTVRNYLSQAMTKLDAQTRSEAATKARDKGWL